MKQQYGYIWVQYLNGLCSTGIRSSSSSCTLLTGLIPVASDQTVIVRLKSAVYLLCSQTFSNEPPSASRVIQRRAVAAGKNPQRKPGIRLLPPWQLCHGCLQAVKCICLTSSRPDGTVMNRSGAGNRAPHFGKTGNAVFETSYVSEHQR